MRARRAANARHRQSSRRSGGRAGSHAGAPRARRRPGCDGYGYRENWVPGSLGAAASPGRRQFGGVPRSTARERPMGRYTVMFSSGTSQHAPAPAGWPGRVDEGGVAVGAVASPAAGPAGLLEGMAFWLDARSPLCCLRTKRTPRSTWTWSTTSARRPQRLLRGRLVEPAARRRGRRLRGVGDFTDLRQLSLLAGAGPMTFDPERGRKFDVSISRSTGRSAPWPRSWVYIPTRSGESWGD